MFILLEAFPEETEPMTRMHKDMNRRRSMRQQVDHNRRFGGKLSHSRFFLISLRRHRKQTWIDVLSSGVLCAVGKSRPGSGKSTNVICSYKGNVCAEIHNPTHGHSNFKLITLYILFNIKFDINHVNMKQQKCTEANSIKYMITTS